MSLNLDYSSAAIELLPIELLIEAIGNQLEQVRLSRNQSQSSVAKEAGVSRRTISRMESGETVSLDTFVRVLKVYGIVGRLDKLFPATEVRPLDRVKKAGKQRQRASASRKAASEGESTSWSWDD